MLEQDSLLIVDDDRELCQTLADVLEAKGYKTVSAYNGKEAVTKAMEQRFNVALVDIKLPDIDGVELLVKLKELVPEIEGIIITGYASLESAVEALKCGALDYVMKPLEIEEVLASVGEALKRQKLSREEKERLDRELKEKEFYRSLATVDGLTGLHTHRRFQELLVQEIGRARRYSHPLSLLMIDIDEFKKYQDAYGHLAGDEALRRIAQALRSSVRGADIIARYGGEEFAVLMPEIGKHAAAVAAERVRRTIAEAEMPSGSRLTVSIGVASYPENGEDKEEFISGADKALYRAKQLGRNRVKVWELPN